jgi:hypothetical protein
MATFIEQWEAEGDRRAIFLRCYALTTDNVLAGIEGGRFHDPLWMSRLLEHFADYYFASVTSGLDGVSHAPQAWLTAHRLAHEVETAACEALLLGVNAHINNDLPQATCDLLTEEWPLPADQLAARHDDFCGINGVIAETMHTAELEIVEPYDRALAMVDGRLPRVMRAAEWELQRVISGWRSEVWENALALLTAVDDRWRRLIRERIERSAARRAHLFICEIELREHLITLPAHQLEHMLAQHTHTGPCRVDAVPPSPSDVVAVATT